MLKIVTKLVILMTICQVQFVYSKPDNGRCEEFVAPEIPNTEMQAEFRVYIDTHKAALDAYLEQIRTTLEEFRSLLSSAIVEIQDGNTSPCYSSLLTTLGQFDSYISNLNGYKTSMDTVFVTITNEVLPQLATAVEQHAKVLDNWVTCLNQIKPAGPPPKRCDKKECTEPTPVVLVPYISPECLATLNTSLDTVMLFPKILVELFINEVFESVVSVTLPIIGAKDILFEASEFIVDTITAAINCEPDLCL